MDYSVIISLTAVLAAVGFLVHKSSSSSTVPSAALNKKFNPLKSRELEVEKKEFTAEEVSRHCTPDDLWIIVKGKVYNVTDYVDTHFGGEEAICRYGGKDNTSVFYGDQHPQPKAEDVLDEYFIGVLKK